MPTCVRHRQQTLARSAEHRARAARLNNCKTTFVFMYPPIEGVNQYRDPSVCPSVYLCVACTIAQKVHILYVLSFLENTDRKPHSGSRTHSSACTATESDRDRQELVVSRPWGRQLVQSRDGDVTRQRPAAGNTHIYSSSLFCRAAVSQCAFSHTPRSLCRVTILYHCLSLFRQLSVGRQ